MERKRHYGPSSLDWPPPLGRFERRCKPEQRRRCLITRRAIESYGCPYKNHGPGPKYQYRSPDGCLRHTVSWLPLGARRLRVPNGCVQ